MEIVGLSRDKILSISKIKEESDYFRKYRLDSYEKFLNLPMPKFGPKIDIDFEKIIYYKNSLQDRRLTNNWNEVLRPIRDELDSVIWVVLVFNMKVK